MKAPFGFLARVWVIALLILAGLVAMFLLPPLRQAQAYHQFADQRSAWGIPNFLNVASNAPFL